MRLVLCCFCAARPEGKDVVDSEQDIYSSPTLWPIQPSKSQTAAAQVEDDCGGGATVSSLQQPGTDEDAQAQRNSTRLAKHLLERQPSKINRAKLQSSSFGGLAAQRWITHSDGVSVEGSTHNGSAHLVPLLQEVKPLHDPISGPAPSRFGTPSAGFGFTGHGVGSVGTSSMTFARSVNRLSTINGSGVGSRRASLLDIDLTKASLAIGSTILRSSMAGNAPHNVHLSEPWMLHHILRGPPPHAHTASNLVASYGAGTGAMSGANGAPGPGPNAVWATVAANLGSVHDREPRECTASSLGHMNSNSPMASHVQHPLTAHHTAYPVPLVTKSQCDCAAGLPNPVVILLVQPAVAGDPIATSGHAGLDRQSLSGPGFAEPTGRLGSRCSADDAAVVVTNMYLDLPRHARRGAAATACQPQPMGDPAGDNEVRRAHAALAAALQGLSGRHVDLTHAWHNKAAAAMMTQAASSAVTPAGVMASAIASAATDVGSDSACGRQHAGGTVAAAAAALAGGDTAVVLWGLRELLDDDPCLSFLAKDLLRQAAVRPEHVPPCAHTLAPSVYSTLLAGREPLPAAAMRVGPLGPSHQGPLGAVTLQAAMQIGQVRVHVCAYQTTAPTVSSRPVVTSPAGPIAAAAGPIAAAAGPAVAAPPASVWLPAVVLEWPQAIPQVQHPGALPPPVRAGRSHSSLAINMHSATPLPRGIMSSAQLRVHPDTEGRIVSAAQLTDLSPLAVMTGASIPGPAAASLLFGSLVPRYTGPGDVTGQGSMESIQPGMPSLMLGMGGVSGPLLAASVPSPTPIGGSTAPEVAAGVGESGYGGAVADGAQELEPLAGAELLYVIQTWQRHHLLLASVPYAITLFDCGGRVLQQNQGSVEFMGEITRDSSDTHPHHPPHTSTGIASTGGVGSEARESVAFMAKAEATGRASGTPSGPAGGVRRTSGIGTSATVEASDVDVLSVLFCLCPDLLDEMLEEIICGNMWRGIVQVPRVMRPCIRAAQRWVAAARTSTNAKHRPCPAAAEATTTTMATAAANATIPTTEVNGSRNTEPTCMQSDHRPTSSLAAAVAAAGGPYFGSHPATVVTSSPPPSRHPAASSSRAAPASTTRPQQRSPTYPIPNTPPPSSSNANTDTGDAPAVPEKTVATGKDGVTLGSPIDVGVPPMQPPAAAASPLRKLATSMALMTTKGMPGNATFPRATAAGPADDAEPSDIPTAMPSFPATGSNVTIRRPPARTYSLRGLVGSMSTSRSFTQPPSSRHFGVSRPAPVEMAAPAAGIATGGGVNKKGTAASLSHHGTAAVFEKYRTEIGTAVAGKRTQEGVGASIRRGVPDADEDKGDPATAVYNATAFRSFTVGMAKRTASAALPIPVGRTRSMAAPTLVRPPYDLLHPEGSQQPPQPQRQQPSAAASQALLLLQQQLPKLPGPAPTASSGFAAPVKPRSAVLAFAERLRSGRSFSGDGNGGGGGAHPGSAAVAAADGSGGAAGAGAGKGGAGSSVLPPDVRSVPKRLRSSLSMVSGPGSGLPPPSPASGGPEVAATADEEEGSGGSPTAHCGAPQPVTIALRPNRETGGAVLKRGGEDTWEEAPTSSGQNIQSPRRQAPQSPDVLVPSGSGGMGPGGMGPAGLGAGGMGQGSHARRSQLKGAAVVLATNVSSPTRGIVTLEEGFVSVTSEGQQQQQTGGPPAAVSSGEAVAYYHLQVWPNIQPQPSSPLPQQERGGSNLEMPSESTAQPIQFSFSTVIADTAGVKLTTGASTPGASANANANPPVAIATTTTTQSQNVFGNPPAASSLEPITATDSRVEEAVSDPSLSAVDLRPHRSVPLQKIQSPLGNPDTDTDPWVVRGSAPTRPGMVNAGYYSTSGVGGTGTCGSHARGGVRRQMHAFKRPLSRSSTRSYIMSALPTSTLSVVGRVQSQRDMEYKDNYSDEDLSVGNNKGDKGDGAAGGNGRRRDLRAMSQGMNVLARKRIGSTHNARGDVRRTNSSSLNVSAVEPRMAVPRIFSFMRSASRRLLQQQQQQQQQAAAAAAADGGHTVAGASRSPPLRVGSADVDADLTRGSGGGICRNGQLYGSSPRCSVEQRTTPSTLTGRSMLIDLSSATASRGSASGVNAAADRPSRISAAGLTPPPSYNPSHAGGGPSGGAAGAFASPVCNEGSTAAGGSSASGDHAVPSYPGQGGSHSGLHPQLCRVRSVDGLDGARMMSPRDMAPADMARRVGMAWHEVAATSFTDPVTGARVVALVQNDVSEKVETEMQLTELMEVEHRLLEQIFPRHVLEHIAMQNISAAAHSSSNNIAGVGSGGGGAGSGRRQRRMSQFDLLKSQDCSQLAHHHEQITILFCDVKGFTAMCSSVEPAVVMSFLNILYTHFDSLLHLHDVYKVETIGDCYMVAGGLVRRGPDGVAALLEPGEVDPDHARNVVRFAKDLLEVVRQMRMPNGQALEVRVGIHSGPAMSGVVGTKMPRFCLFGDTINTASRCESTCPAGVIQVTTSVRDLVPEEPWVATEGVVAKGKGMLRTFILGPSDWAPTAPSSGAEEAFASGSGFVHPPPSSLAIPSDAGVGNSSGSGEDPPVIGRSPSSTAMAKANNINKATTVAGGGSSSPKPPASGSLTGVTTLANIITASAGTPTSSGVGGGIGGGGGSVIMTASTTPAGSHHQTTTGPPQFAAASTSCYLRLSSTNLAYAMVKPSTSTSSVGAVRRFAPAGELPHIETRPGSLLRPGCADEVEDASEVPRPHELRVVNFRASAAGGVGDEGGGGVGASVMRGGVRPLGVDDMEDSAAVGPVLLNGTELVGLEGVSGALGPSTTFGTADTRQHDFLLPAPALPVTAPLQVRSGTTTSGAVLLPFGSKSEPAPAHGAARAGAEA